MSSPVPRRPLRQSPVWLLCISMLLFLALSISLSTYVTAHVEIEARWLGVLITAFAILLATVAKGRSRPRGIWFGGMLVIAALLTWANAARLHDMAQRPPFSMPALDREEPETDHLRRVRAYRAAQESNPSQPEPDLDLKP